MKIVFYPIIAGLGLLTAPVYAADYNCPGSYRAIQANGNCQNTSVNVKYKVVQNTREFVRVFYTAFSNYHSKDSYFYTFSKYSPAGNTWSENTWQAEVMQNLPKQCLESYQGANKTIVEKGACPEKPKNCTLPDGSVIEHGQKRMLYTESFSINCPAPVEVACDNGKLSNPGALYPSCRKIALPPKQVEHEPSKPVVTSKQCDFNGQKYAVGQTVTAFEQAVVSEGSTCKSEVRTCLQSGTFSGKNESASCYQVGSIDKPSIETCPEINIPFNCSTGTMSSPNQNRSASGTCISKAYKSYDCRDAVFDFTCTGSLKTIRRDCNCNSTRYEAFGSRECVLKTTGRFLYASYRYGFALCGYSARS